MRGQTFLTCGDADWAFAQGKGTIATSRREIDGS